MTIRYAVLVGAIAALLAGFGANASEEGASKANTSTADHTTFAILKQDFASGPDVTKACLTCHTNAAKQVHKTEHWTWTFNNVKASQILGKRNVVNNFCTTVRSNMDHCAECHVGYNFKDETFNFASEENVDCLVCHDTTGRYKKDPNNFGNPLKSINLKMVAQSVGKTSRKTCGECHFNAGGGDGVKHGDLDSTLEEPSKDLDVHMNAEGLNFPCATCHKTEGHQVPGSRYAPTAKDTAPAHMRGRDEQRNPATCQDCHGQVPHKERKLNDHTAKLACQTCHVPAFARGGQPTKMSWDWSTVGKRAPNGKPLVEKNEDGYETYNGGKGSSTWAENVVPDYIWFNGTVKYKVLGEKIAKSEQPVHINEFQGSPTDGKSRIWPVKVFRGKQAYDPVNQTLIVTHLSGHDDAALWTNMDWQKAAKVGMASVNLPFSGEIDFVSTEMSFPITHMVAPKEKAVACKECHSEHGRLEHVPGLNIPILKE